MQFSVTARNCHWTKLSLSCGFSIWCLFLQGTPQHHLWVCLFASYAISCVRGCRSGDQGLEPVPWLLGIFVRSQPSDHFSVPTSRRLPTHSDVCNGWIDPTLESCCDGMFVPSTGKQNWFLQFSRPIFQEIRYFISARLCDRFSPGIYFLKWFIDWNTVIREWILH